MAITQSLKFEATPEKGLVSARLNCPADAIALLVLGHGASTPLDHRIMESIALHLSEAKLATFRYNFPYMERGGGGRDSQNVTLATIKAAVETAQGLSHLPLLAGGHSFGGRMTSIAAAEQILTGVQGLIFFGFPLHAPGKPGLARAAHLSAITIPMLFLSGTRDNLAQPDLLQQVCTQLQGATLHWLDTANHGYKTLKRVRPDPEDVYREMANLSQKWTQEQIL